MLKRLAKRVHAIRYRFVAFALAATLCLSTSASAEAARPSSVAASPVTEPNDVGESDAYIDWSARELYAWGEGKAPREVPLLVEALPFAEQAALEAARRAMRILVADSKLLPERLVKQLEGDPAPKGQPPARGTLRNLLNRLVRGAGDEGSDQRAIDDARIVVAIGAALQSGRAARTSYADDGSVKLQLRLPLDGGRGGLGEAWMRLRPARSGDVRPPRHNLRAGTLPSVRPPTGIVVQARGLNVTPHLWPRLVRGRKGCDEQESLYGQEYLSDEMLRSYGVAPFVRSIEAALRAPRVADRAMLVRASGRCPQTAATLWVDDADAEAIQAEQELLREGRVVIVTD